MALVKGVTYWRIPISEAGENNSALTALIAELQAAGSPYADLFNFDLDFSMTSQFESGYIFAEMENLSDQELDALDEAGFSLETFVWVHSTENPNI